MIRSDSIERIGSVSNDVSGELTRMVHRLGVVHAFGVSGGGIGPVWRALINDLSIETLHFRNEAGAAFAAIEASLERRGAVAVFCTTGPGITNTLTGMAAARAEGAKVLLISGRTSPAQRGRGAVQETPMPSADFFTPGWLFDEVFMLESSAELPQIERRLQHGIGRAGSYLAHISIPLGLQSAPAELRPAPPEYQSSHSHPDPAAVGEVVRLMRTKRCAIWVGHGARHAARQVRALVDLTGVPVIATPRGKGIVPENSPSYLMVTGLGGHAGGIAELGRYDPEFMLVLGTRLGEASSGWERRLVPRGGLVHVDIDVSVPGTAFDAPILAIQADVGTFVDQILRQADGIPHRGFSCASPFPEPVAYREKAAPIRPRALLQAVQKLVADTGLPILVEPGGSMAWATHMLAMANPGQLRIVGSLGSMGQMTCGVLGSAIARRGTAVCLTGDGSLLMNNEINTAVQYDIPAVWMVLNNARYQMCELGMEFGADEKHARFPKCDFAGIAHAMGAKSASVRREADLEPLLQRALRHGGPYLLDIAVDPDAPPPFESRFKTLR